MKRELTRVGISHWLRCNAKYNLHSSFYVCLFWRFAMVSVASVPSTGLMEGCMPESGSVPPQSHTGQRCVLCTCYWDNLAKNVQVSPPQPGLERQQAATPKCHWKFSFIGLIVRTSIVDLRAGPGQIYGNWNVSPPALLHYNTEYLDSFT